MRICFQCRVHLSETTGVNCTGFSNVKQMVMPVKFTRDSGCLAHMTQILTIKNYKYVYQHMIPFSINQKLITCRQTLSRENLTGFTTQTSG